MSSATRMLRSAIERTLGPASAAVAGRMYRRVRYGGRAIECPCCGGGFRRFLPGIDSTAEGRVRDGILCPECCSLTRQRLLYLYLKNELGLFDRPCRLLHLAPEPCLERSFRLAAGLRYVTADLVSENVDVHIDLTRVGFRDASFDVVLCSHVFEHIPDDAAAIREVMRVIGPDGVAIVLVPLDESSASTYEDWSITRPEDRLRAFGQEDHVRLYGRDFVARLTAGGADVQPLAYAQVLGAEATQRFALDTRETLFVCRNRT